MPAYEPLDALVIGAGPAGLMAAEALANRGRRVVICEAMPTAGRKFLMAGKSGLNLMNAAPLSEQLSLYAEAESWLEPALRAFGPDEIRAWAEGLGQDLFVGSSGRVFPVALKAAPLLRAWLGQLAAKGVELRCRWRWVAGRRFCFQTPGGVCELAPRVAVLALGGASWRRLGSDGEWAAGFAAEGMRLAPFQPANMGMQAAWSEHMRPFFGAPIKGVVLRAGAMHVRAEFVISARGVEGGAIYALSRPLRAGAHLIVDLFPDLTRAQIAERLSHQPRKLSQKNRLRRALGLEGARFALLLESARPLPQDASQLAGILKTVALPLAGPRPLDEAISTAGGLRRDGLTDTLMLREWRGVFAAGEMLDWEAPTGGYLLTACLATGHWAGRHAASY